MMEGLDYVKDGDKASIGLGYWLMNVVHLSKEQEMTPLFNKLYSFDCGAKSENKEKMHKLHNFIYIAKRIQVTIRYAWAS